MASWLKCRYYENILPELDTLVMVNIKQTTEMGVYVKLLEYDYIDAMIPLSEISRRRIRSLNKHVRIGQNEVAVVIRVDKEKGYIDLSKSRVSDEDIIKCRENYQNLKVAHSIVRHVAEKLGIPVAQLYETISWPLAKKYGTALEAFRISIVVPSVWDGIEFASPKLKEELVKYIAMRLTPNPIKLRADIEVQCFGYDGIDAIKKALHAGEALATKDIALKVKLVAPPLYVLNCYRCYDAQEGIRVMKKALDAIKKSIESIDGGTFVLAMEPRAVNAVDDEILKKLMARKERENREVSADGDKDLPCEYGFEHAPVKW